jgi:hypothetical protein
MEQLKMNLSSLAKYPAVATAALSILAACSAGASPAFGPSGAIPAARAVAPAARHGVAPDRACAGNALYFSDNQNSTIDSFNALGGTYACTITAGGLSNPMGIWVQPVAGTYYNYLFAANAGNGTAVAYKTPLTNSSVPEWQFNAGGVASDVVQDMFGNVYVAEYGTPNIAVFTPPFSACAYPSGCSPAYSIADPCGTVDWLATDGKGDVYSNNYCGYVTLFVTPIAAGEVGTKLVGTAFSQPGGMIVDKHNELVVNDQATDKITSYGLNVLRSEATARFTLAPYSGAIFGIGLDKTNKFLWGANVTADAGQRYSFSAGGIGGTPSASDPSLVVPFGAAVRPSSAE